jgi:hypothetical protein
LKEHVEDESHFDVELPSREPGNEDEVRGRRDGEELGDALDDPENQGLKKAHPNTLQCPRLPGRWK